MDAVAPNLESINLDQAELTFHSIKVDGRPVEFRVFERSVSIDLGIPLLVGQTVIVEIDYSCTPRRGLFFRGPDFRASSVASTCFHTRSIRRFQVLVSLL